MKLQRAVVLSPEAVVLGTSRNARKASWQMYVLSVPAQHESAKKT